MPSLFAAAPAFVPCPSASALACRCCCRRLSSLACQRPPLPAVIVAPNATDVDGGGRTWQIVTVPPPPSPSRRCPCPSATTIIVATKPSAAVAAINLVIFGRSNFSQKAKECNLYIYIFRFGFLSIDHYREEWWCWVQG